MTGPAPGDGAGPGGDDGAPVTLDEAALTALVVRVLVRHGMSPATAPTVAAAVAAAERDGAASHGVMRMPGYAASLAAGWVDGAAVPRVVQETPALLSVDAGNGFAQVALAAVRERAVETAGRMGSCAVSIRNSHHFAALWPDVEPFAERGLVALTMVNSRSHLVAWGGRRKVMGTNPVAFACPRDAGPPVVWDQASSVRAQGEVILARNRGERVPAGVGVDRDGAPTEDPAAILDGGALLPFSGAKGANLAFMVEILCAAFGGGQFGFEVDSSGHPGAQTSRTGQFLLLLDPARAGARDFGARVEGLLGTLRDAGSERLPGGRRHERRAVSRAEGIRVGAGAYRALLALAG